MRDRIRPNFGIEFVVIDECLELSLCLRAATPVYSVYSAKKRTTSERRGSASSSHPEHEQREGNEQEVEWSVGALAAREVEGNCANLKRRAAERGNGRQEGCDARQRREEHAQTTQQVEDGSRLQEARRYLPCPRDLRGELRNGRRELPYAGADDGDEQKGLDDPDSSARSIRNGNAWGGGMKAVVEHVL